MDSEKGRDAIDTVYSMDIDFRKFITELGVSDPELIVSAQCYCKHRTEFIKWRDRAMAFCALYVSTFMSEEDRYLKVVLCNGNWLSLSYYKDFNLPNTMCIMNRYPRQRNYDWNDQDNSTW